MGPHGFRCLVPLLLAGSLSAHAFRQSAAGDESAPGTTREQGLAFHGRLSTRLSVRTDGDAVDVDLAESVDVTAGDEARDPWTARVGGRVWWDVDSNTGDPFDGLSETYDSAVQLRLYDAYVDRHGVEHLSRLRIGRQSDWATPEFLVYDGVHVETTELGDTTTRVGVYGGQSVHHFESSPEGDVLAGAYLTTRPWKRGRLRLDWVHAEDEEVLGSTSEDLLGLAFWQTVGSYKLQLGYTLLADQSRDVDLRATWIDPDADMLVRVSYYQLFETQAANPLEFDTFSRVLFDYFPFYRAGLLVSRGLTEHVRVDGGLELREVRDDTDEGTYNRDYQRYYLTLGLDALGTPDTHIDLTGDLWNSDAQEVTTWGIDLTQRLSEQTELGLGSYYAAYNFDSLLATERENVRTYYGSLDHELNEALDLALVYDFEDAEIDDYHTLRVKLTWRF